METKICSKCGEEKTLDKFHFRNDTKKHRADCIECYKKVKRIYSEQNKEKILLYHKNHHKENKEIINEKKRVYYSQNKEKFHERRVKNRDYMKEFNRNYNIKNRKRISKKKLEYYHKKLKNSINYRIRSSLSSQIRGALKNKKNGRPWETIVGYTLKDLIVYIESQFNENINWNNYGSYWQIDHIIPQAIYNFTNENEIKKCWNLRNLRPLNKTENNSKNSKLFINLIEECNIKDLLPKNVLY